MVNESKPGVSRDSRSSNEGLLRLQKQFQTGTRISDRVLQQWVQRYGEEARVIIQKYRPEFKNDN